MHTKIHTLWPFSGTTRVNRCNKGKTDLDFTAARDSEWQWHQLGHMQVCTSLQTDNYASTPPLSFYRPDALPAARQRRSTEVTAHMNHINSCTLLSYSSLRYSVLSATHTVGMSHLPLLPTSTASVQYRVLISCPTEGRRLS